LSKKILKFIGKSQMNFLTKSVVLITATALVAACGGGGGGSTPAANTSTLSVTQQNFEASAMKDTYVTFDWNVPTTNVVPTNGTHFFVSNSNSALTSPSNGAVLNSQAVTNLTTGMGIPNQTQRYVDRTIKSGILYARNSMSKQMWSYAGSDVAITSYATDGVTPMFSSTYDNWSAAIPLSGQIGTATILKSFLGFSRLNTPLNFDFTKSWLAGASYFTRKGYRTADTLFVYDWNGTTYDSNVTAYTGPETTIEAFFGNATFVTAGGWSVDNVLYNLASGTISSKEGVRAWIANAKRPTSALPTDEFLILAELNGKIYVGGLQKAGARLNSIDGVDATIVNDFHIRLNSNAADSIKQTVKF
jgi:hypothetical protein